MAIDLLSIEPHKVSKNLSGYITYIYGEAKIGKTSLAAQAEDCLLIATERGYNAISGIVPIDVPDWRTMRQVYNDLKRKEVQARFKTIIVDTVDLAAAYCTKYICNQKEVEDLGDLGWGKGYKLMRSEFESVFNGLAQLGYSIIFISHVNRVVDEKTGVVTIGPTLSPSRVNDIIRNMADIYGWAHYSDDENSTGDRILTLRSDSDDISCGCRFKYIPAEIPFSYNDLVKALKFAVEEEEKHNGKDAVTDESNIPVYQQEDVSVLLEEFKEILAQLKNNVTKERFNSKWAPFIGKLIVKNLGEGKKIYDATNDQYEQVGRIIDDLKEEMGNGI